MHAAQDDLVVWGSLPGSEGPGGEGSAGMKVPRLDRRLAVRRELPVLLGKDGHLPVSLPQHADEHCPERLILLAVDQQLGEGATLRVAPDLSDPVDPVGVGEHQDVDSLGARSRGNHPENGGTPGEEGSASGVPIPVLSRVRRLRTGAPGP